MITFVHKTLNTIISVYYFYMIQYFFWNRKRFDWPRKYVKSKVFIDNRRKLKDLILKTLIVLNA